ncbi:MAG: hypothetical protein E4H40_08190, partial [Candidatus Brocadiia bacterium]
MNEKLLNKTLVAFAILLPPAIVFSFVSKLGITIPFWDQWEFVPLLEKLYNHTLTFGDVWKPHNEHRIIFPQALMLILAYLSGWNISLELGASFVLAFLTLLCLLSILRNTSESPPSPWLKIIISCLVFSMVQSENWCWGWQIQIFMSIFGTVAAVCALTKWPGRYLGLVLAILAAILSRYSFNIGLITWPVIFLLLLLQKKYRPIHFMIFILSGLTTVALYYYNYTLPSDHQPLFFFLDHPWGYIRYVLTYLGASLGPTPVLSLVMALIILFLAAFAVFEIRRIKKQKLLTLAPWLVLAVYPCIAAIITGLGRAALGWQQALASRYTTITVILVISTIMLVGNAIKLSLNINRKKQLKTVVFAAVVVCVFIVSYGYSYLYGINFQQQMSRYVMESAFCLNYPYNADPAALVRLYPS